MDFAYTLKGSMPFSAALILPKMPNAGVLPIAGFLTRMCCGRIVIQCSRCWPGTAKECVLARV